MGEGGEVIGRGVASLRQVKVSYMKSVLQIGAKIL